MPHSSVITATVLAHPNPLEHRKTIWEQTRYLVAQKQVTETYTETNESYYQGRAVIPGPKADFNLCPAMANMDVEHIESSFGITFIDYATTEGADQDVVSAPFGIMSKAEANDFEKQLRDLKNPPKDK